MKLNRITVLAFNEFKRIKYEGQDITVTNGHVLTSAYELLIPKLNNIHWKKVNKTDIPNVSDNKDNTVGQVNTTLNIKETVSDGILDLQISFKDVFETDRVFKTFVVKLILFAAILELHDSLPLISEKD